VDIILDGIQANINFTADGQLKTDIATTFKTKQELASTTAWP
jgi:hypothetical protein